MRLEGRVAPRRAKKGETNREDDNERSDPSPAMRYETPSS